MPASTAIATLDRQVASMGGMGLVISSALKKVANRYDYVIIDSPPMLGVLMINALAACDHLVIPVLSEYLALKGLDRMLHIIGMVFNSRKIPPHYTIVPTMFDKRTRAARESLSSLRMKYPDHVWKSFIPVDTKVREASQAATPLSLFVKESKAVEAYADLLELLLLDNQQHDKKMAMS
nr:ParA family protein [Methylomarinum sp. Ch1-1]MDP4519381.1 ParA family protein [Methylomarinum sp. Ch1-1]